MPRLLLVLVILLYATPVRADGAFSQCWATSENNVAVALCLGELKRKVDRDLADAYARAQGDVAQFNTVFGDDRVTQALQRAQKSFELYRDLDCAMHGLMAGPSRVDEAFSMACWVDRSRERIAVLAQWRPVPAAERLAGTWRVLAIGEDTVLEGRAVTVAFDAEGKVSGTGGCNRFFGTAQIDDETARLGPLGGTRMACGEAVDQQERRLFMALDRVRRWSFDSQGNLVLRAPEGTPLIRLSRED